MKIYLILCLLMLLPLSISLVVFSFTRRDRGRVLYFSVLAIALVFYVLGYLLELSATTIEAVKISLLVQNFSIPLIAPFFFLFILSLCQPAVVRPRYALFALAYGFLVFLVVFFNDFHRLYYTDILPVFRGGDFYAALPRGILYYIQQLITHLFLLASYLVLFGSFHAWLPETRKRMRFIFLASLVVFVANVMMVFSVFPPGIDSTPIAMTLSLAIASLGVMRYQIFDIVPIASESALETMDDAMLVLNLEWCCLFANRSAMQLFPALKSFKTTVPITHLPGWPNELAPRQVSSQVTFHRFGAGQKIEYFRAGISTIVDGDTIKGYSIVIRDVTDTTLLMLQFETSAKVDFLTDIYNRRTFFDLAEAELQHAKRHDQNLALILFDIDHFKQINDTYGHAAGDAVLQQVVHAVKKEIRIYDVFARFGGEEFILLAAGIQEDLLRSFTQRLCDIVAQTDIHFHDHVIPVTASFGAVLIDINRPFEDAVAAADTAMYRAKDSGRNSVMLHSDSDLFS